MHYDFRKCNYQTNLAAKGFLPRAQAAGFWHLAHSPQPVTWGRWVGLLQFRWSEAISKQNRGKAAPEPKETTGLSRNISSSKLNQSFFHQTQDPAAASSAPWGGRGTPLPQGAAAPSACGPEHNRAVTPPCKCLRKWTN